MPNNQRFSTQTRALEEDTVLGKIERYEDHPSINLIKSKNTCLVSTFSFTPVSIGEVKKSIRSLDPKKAGQEKYILTKNFKTKFGFFYSSCAEGYQCFHFCFKIQKFLLYNF